jgi:hypothetical protein
MTRCFLSKFPLHRLPVQTKCDWCTKVGKFGGPGRARLPSEAQAKTACEKRSDARAHQRWALNSAVECHLHASSLFNTTSRSGRSGRAAAVSSWRLWQRSWKGRRRASHVANPSGVMVRCSGAANFLRWNGKRNKGSNFVLARSWWHISSVGIVVAFIIRSDCPTS